MRIVQKRRLAIAAYLVYLALFYAVLFFEIVPVISYTSIFGLIGNILAFPMFWSGIKIHDEERRLPWMLFAVTGVLYFLGDFLWAYHASVLGNPPEMPSICDFFYILNSYACCAAFVCYIYQQERTVSGRVLIDTVLSILLTGDMLYRFIILPLLKDNSVTLEELAFHANMSVIDLSLLAGILIIIYGTAHNQSFTRQSLWMGVSFFVCCFVEQLSLAIAVYELPHAQFFDPLWTLPFWLFALTSMYPDEEDRNEEMEEKHRQWGERLECACRCLPYFLTAVAFWLIGPLELASDIVFVSIALFLALRFIKRMFSGNKGGKEVLCD